MENMLNMLKISIIVSCVVLLLILLKPVLRRRYHAKWKYYVWLCLAVVLLIPLSPVGWQLTEATEEYAPIQIEVPSVDRRFDAGETAVTAPAQPVTPTVVPTQPHTPAVIAPAQEEQRERSAEETIVMIWIAGMAAFAAYYGVGTAVFYRRAMRWSCAADGRVAKRSAELTAEMGIRRTIPVLVSGEITSPMMIGFFRPRLLLSAGEYKEQELDFILRHELTHYKRHDLWYKLALLTANCVHWFNPFSWLMVREAAIDMELTCDDAVVAGGDTALRRAYSETLLASLHRQSGLNVALSTHFYGGKETMKERFHNLLGGGRRKRGMLILCVVLVVTVAAACLIGFSVPKEEKAEPLTAEELEQWQERLNSSGYNGFVTHMYTEAKYIRLSEVLYNGAGLTHTPDQAEVQAYLAATGMEELYTDLEAISAPELEIYVQEKIGLALDEFAAPLGWTYVEEYDSYYFMHGDTNFAGVEVVSGEQLEDTVTLEIKSVGGMTQDGTLTITDGKFVSFTNSVYTAVEAIALEQLQALSTYDDGSVAKHAWIGWLWPGLSVEGNGRTYYVWHMTSCVEPKEGTPLPEIAYNGVIPYEGSLLVYVDEEGTVTQLEAEHAMGGDTPQHTYMDLTMEEYILYKYEYELELARRQSGWPELSSQLVYSVHAGTETWTQQPEEVAKGWCLSWGDELAEYEMLKSWTPGSQYARADMLVRVVTKEARTAMLLLSQVKTDFEDVTYWEVLGYRLLDGPALPEERVGEDWRSTSATLSLTIEGMEEQVPVYLFSGGGDYGIREWSMYIPYENWSCNYLTNRWCPSPEDMGLSIQVLEYDAAGYSFERFFASYAEQFDQVWTNADQIGSGAANVGWAMGYQSTAGGRYTQSRLYQGDGKFYEVMWTYSAEQAEGWGVRLGWTASTFSVIGGDDVYNTGTLTDEEAVLESELPMVVTQAESTEFVSAGTYLVLPENSMAFRLEDAFAVFADEWLLFHRMIDSYYPARYKAYRVNEISSVYCYDNVEGLPMIVFSVDWDVKTDPPLDWEMVGADGYHKGETAWLVVEHDGGRVTRSLVMMDSGGRPGDATFTTDLKDALQRGEAYEHTTLPAIFYDRGSGGLYALHTTPNQSA